MGAQHSTFLKRYLHEATICLLLVVGVSLPCRAVDLAQQVEFDIPPQKLSSALIQFSHQAKVQVVVAENLGEQVTDGVSGRHAIRDALTRLLKPSGLSYHPVGETSITVGKPGQIAQSGSAARLAVGTSDRPVPDAVTGNEIALEEIIVTAQKRAENVRDVPASITVMGGQQLANMSATRLTDYAAYVPGLQVDTDGTPGQTAITLRGINAISPTAVVGSYIDDVPMGSSSGLARGSQFALDMLPYDIDRVEILRGPQGTLYGASTMGGLIKYVTRSADLNEFEARAQGEVSTIEGAGDVGWGVRAGTNVPLIEGTLALRASYFNQRTPGYIDNGKTGAKDEGDLEQQGGRVSLTWQPSETVSVKLAAMLQNIDAQSRSQMTLDPTTLQPIYGDLTSANDLRSPFEQQLQFYSATVNWDLGWADFTSASSYASADTTQVQDGTPGFAPLLPVLTQGATLLGFTPFSLDLELDKVTQEFRLASPSGDRVEWLLGAFYTDEDSHNRQLVRTLDAAGNPILAPTFNPFTGAPILRPDGTPELLDPLAAIQIPSGYREYAVFGNLTYRFTDRFDVTAGLRWARNSQDFSQESLGPLIVVAGAPPRAVGKSDEDVLTYLISPRFHVNDDLMIYGRVASGYRPGGPNVALAGVPPTVDADTIVNYELGVKTQLLERRVLMDIAIFRIDWEDIQLTVPAPGGVSYGENGGKARSQGVELASMYSPLTGLRLGMTVAFTDATLSEDVPELSGRSGDRLPNSARWSGSVTTDYERPIGADWFARVGAGYRYVGNRYSAVESSPAAIRSASYGVVDLNASLFDDRWAVRLFAKNLANKRTYLTPSVFYDAFGGAARIDASVLQPRTLGVSLDVRF
jgi:iron complex outermembrane recepter protein